LGVLVGGGMVLMGGLAGAAGAVRSTPVMAAGGAVIAVLGAFVVLLSLGEAVVNYFLWRGHNWARITSILLLVLQMLLALPRLFNAPTPEYAAGVIGGILISLLF